MPLSRRRYKRSTGQCFINRRQEIGTHPRFHDVAQRPKRSRSRNVVLVVLHRQEDDRPPESFRLELFRCEKAIQTRHTDVEDYQIGIEFGHGIQGKLSILNGGHNLKIVIQQIPNRVEGAGMIVGHDYPGTTK